LSTRAALRTVKDPSHAGATIFYLAYWFTGSFGLGFGAIHYFKMWFPLWTIAAMLAVVEGVRALAAQRVTSRHG
jgi:hypothetical protein